MNVVFDTTVEQKRNQIFTLSTSSFDSNQVPVLSLKVSFSTVIFETSKNFLGKLSRGNHGFEPLSITCRILDASVNHHNKRRPLCTLGYSFVYMYVIYHNIKQKFSRNIFKFLQIKKLASRIQYVLMARYGLYGTT